MNPIQYEWSDVCFFEEDPTEETGEKVTQKFEKKVCNLMENMYPIGRFLLHSAGCFGIINDGDEVNYNDHVIGVVEYDNETGYSILGLKSIFPSIENQRFHSFEGIIKELNFPDSCIVNISVHTKDDDTPCMNIDSIQKKILHYVSQYPKLIKGLKHMKKVIESINRGDIYNKLSNEIGIIESLNL